MDVVESIRILVARHGAHREQLLELLRAIDAEFGCVSDAAIDALAAELGLRRVEIVDAATFYAFLAREPRGRTRLYFADTPVAAMRGVDAVIAAFARATGALAGTPSADGAFSLHRTSDIGMSDREPACFAGDVVFADLVPEDAPTIVAALRAGTAHAHPKANPQANVVLAGAVLFAPHEPDAGLRSALARAPEEVIGEIARAGLRGRGGAGFPTALKWRLTREGGAAPRYVVCNADEGEPGTFKDRDLLAARAELVVEGMTVAAYAVGAAEGFIYLRAEYAYLRPQLETMLAARRAAGLLGRAICGTAGFDFDLSIRCGAGAYVCGEETALIESLEGKRGVPRDRPPYPTEHGFRGRPTAVNNVETFACVARILARGEAWFAGIGTAESAGTKLMSVSGDCARPGTYEVPFGMTLLDLLDLAGGADAQAVQVSGASGRTVAPKDFGRMLCFEDLPTGGSTMVFGPQRDLLAGVRSFAQFFADESCGWCAPCRAGTPQLVQALDLLLPRLQPWAPCCERDFFRCIFLHRADPTKDGIAIVGGDRSAVFALTYSVADPALLNRKTMADDPSGFSGPERFGRRISTMNAYKA